MVKIWKVNIILCNVLTLHLCKLFLVQGGLPARETMDNTRLPKHDLNYKPRGRRDRGRETMATRRCRNRTSDLIHGGRL